jgi:uncharacterized protein
MTEQIRTLVICGDRWHPPQIPRTGLGALAEAGFAFDWLEEVTQWSPERMARYPLTVLVKANNVSPTGNAPWMTDEIEEAFRDYVRGGAGLLVIHNGTAGYREQAVLRELMGGAFLKHPPQCPVTVEPKAGHPLTAGSTPFTLVDEHYFMELDDLQADLFLTTTSEHGAYPGGWTRNEGAGRVGVLSPGHNLEVWLHPSYKALILNALRWCSQASLG